VAGAAIFVVAMVLVVPVAVMLGGAVWSACFGWLESSSDGPPSGGAAE
jgi:hypothetical protein